MSEKKTNILLVEDDPDHAELIIEGLNVEDIKKKVILMKDGQEIIDYLEETGSSARTVQYDIKGGNIRHSQIDLIILDLNLPRVSGMDILKFLKKNSKYSKIPVIVLSTISDQNTILEAYKNGANGYVTKPMSYDEFVDKIRLLRRYWSDTNILPPQI